MDPSPAPRRGLVRDKHGNFTDIDYPVTPSTRAYHANVADINPQGDIAGNYNEVAGGKSYGFLRTGDGVYTQIYFPGATSSFGDAINARGEIAGWHWSGTPSQSHGFLWRDGVYTTVDYPGSTQTMIHGLNSEGEMCGMVSFSPLGSPTVWGGFSRTW